MFESRSLGFKDRDGDKYSERDGEREEGRVWERVSWKVGIVAIKAGRKNGDKGWKTDRKPGKKMEGGDRKWFLRK